MGIKVVRNEIGWEDGDGFTWRVIETSDRPF